MALISAYVLPACHIVALVGLLVMLVRSERRSDRWERTARDLARSNNALRFDSAKTRVSSAPRW
jgi:hypothetical protein